MQNDVVPSSGGRVFFGEMVEDRWTRKSKIREAKLEGDWLCCVCGTDVESDDIVFYCNRRERVFCSEHLDKGTECGCSLRPRNDQHVLNRIIVVERGDS